MKVHPIDASSRTPAAIDNAPEESPFWSLLAVLLSFIIVTSVVFFIVIGGIFILSSVIQDLCDRKHITTIPELKIDSLTTSNFTLSSRPNQIHAAWNVGISLDAKNTHGYLSFLNVTVSIYYNVLQAGLADVAAFDVVRLNSTRRFEVSFSGSSGLIDESKVNDMNRRIAAGGILAFDVVFQAYVKKSFGGRWTDQLQLVMDCKDIKLFFGNSDKSRAQMLNPPHQCNIPLANPNPHVS